MKGKRRRSGTAQPEPQDYELKRDGDSYEREWFAKRPGAFVAYEPFWREHIVPLTFRCVDRANRFLRPSLPDELHTLADSNYASLYHFTQCCRYAEQLAEREPQDVSGRSELLYCFFSHAQSLLDAMAHLAWATNCILEKHGANEAFAVWRGRGGHLRLNLKDSGKREDSKHNDLQETIRRYRNLLVHEKPVYIQNQYIPKAEYVEEWSGLAAATKAIRDGRSTRTYYEPSRKLLDRILKQMQRCMDVLWTRGHHELSNLKGARYAEAQKSGLKADSRITLEAVERLRRGELG